MTDFTDFFLLPFRYPLLYEFMSAFFICLTLAVENIQHSVAPPVAILAFPVSPKGIIQPFGQRSDADDGAI